jgi:trimeric autotransporter adhesin
MPSGSFEIGGSADSGNFSAFAEFYDLRMSNNAHTPAQVAQNVSALINELSGRGITLFPSIKYVYPNQQLFFAGDSITCGFAIGGTPPCTLQANPYVDGLTSSFAYGNNLSLEQSFGIHNYGTPSAMIEQQASAASVLYAPLCYTQQGQSIASLFEGTNNVTAGESPATTWAYAAGWTKLLHSFGCKTIFISMISRGTSGAEAFKTAYTALVRANWKQAGFDAFIDMESDPFLGCNGCNANTTYFVSDLTHPTPAGQLKLAAAVSATVNYLSNGSTAANPNPTIVTAATYTSTYDDGGLLFNTSANNIVDTLTSAQWMTGRIIKRCNVSTSGSNTLTITAPTDFPFDDAAGKTTVTVAAGACVSFQSTFIAGTPNGDFWAVTSN